MNNPAFPRPIEARLIERFPSGSFPEVVSLYLFGSEADSSAHRDSDVDVGVLLDRGDEEGDRRFVVDAMRRAADLEPWMRRMRRIKLEALRK